MATTINQVEAVPSDYLDPPSGLSTAAAALAPAVIWRRIEAYIVHRFTPRSVTWFVEGAGSWDPPLTPATVATAEVWSLSGGEWQSVTLDASLFGGSLLPDDGPYRFSGEAGRHASSWEVPEEINEAYRRLAEYLVGDRGTPGARSETLSIGGGAITHTVRREPNWLAMALQNSGAADLLRPYRVI